MYLLCNHPSSLTAHADHVILFVFVSVHVLQWSNLLTGVVRYIKFFTQCNINWNMMICISWTTLLLAQVQSTLNNSGSLSPGLPLCDMRLEFLILFYIFNFYMCMCIINVYMTIIAMIRVTWWKIQFRYRKRTCFRCVSASKGGELGYEVLVLAALACGSQVSSDGVCRSTGWKFDRHAHTVTV